MKYYKTCRVKCLNCGDILEYTNKNKLDNSPAMMWCKCGKVGLDPSALAYRVLAKDGFDKVEDLSEEWED